MEPRVCRLKLPGIKFRDIISEPAVYINNASIYARLSQPVTRSYLAINISTQSHVVDL